MDAETLTEPERRVALLDWLARGRDVRIAAELCGEKHDWAKAVAQAAGHPDRDQIRQALAAAKAELHPPRQLLKPDSVAPPRPIRAALVEHVAGYADGMALRRCKVCLGPIDDDGTERTQCHRCRTVLALASGAPTPTPEVPSALAAAEQRPSIVAEANANDWPPPGHVHEPRVVLEGRLWHAVCDACGTTWHRTRCTAPGCGAYVSAEYVARTGSTRHDWHPKEQS